MARDVGDGAGLLTAEGGESEAKHERSRSPRSRPAVPQSVAQRPRRVCIMRHGLKEENVLGKDNFSLPLTVKGKQALAELAAFCDGLEVRFGRALCSPYLRCRETAEALVHLVSSGCIELEPGLCEVMSNRTGLRNARGLLGDEALARLRPRLEEVMRAEGGPQSAKPLFNCSELEHDSVEQGPEACRQVVERGLALVHRFSDEHFAGGTLLLVTHGGPCKALISGFLDGEVQPYNKYKLPEMGSMTFLEQRGPGGPWRVVGNVTPGETPDGSWELRWHRGRASDSGDVAKL